MVELQLNLDFGVIHYVFLLFKGRPLKLRTERSETDEEEKMESKSEGMSVLQTLINRTQILLHSIALLLLISYRFISFLFQIPQTTTNFPRFFLILLLFASELLLAFIWFLGRASRWRPQISKPIFTHNLPEKDDGGIPGIDVFICTADPEKEPTLEVMNTLISAMALDYPPDKLHVYFSDDGGSPVTLRAIRDAWRFARWWVPFCRKYRVMQPCPEAYFSAAGEHCRRDFPMDELMEQKLIVWFSSLSPSLSLKLLVRLLKIFWNFGISFDNISNFQNFHFVKMCFKNIISGI